MHSQHAYTFTQSEQEREGGWRVDRKTKRQRGRGEGAGGGGKSENKSRALPCPNDAPSSHAVRTPPDQLTCPAGAKANARKGSEASGAAPRDATRWRAASPRSPEQRDAPEQPAARAPTTRGRARRKKTRATRWAGGGLEWDGQGVRAGATFGRQARVMQGHDVRSAVDRLAVALLVDDREMRLELPAAARPARVTTARRRRAAAWEMARTR